MLHKFIRLSMTTITIMLLTSTIVFADTNIIIEGNASGLVTVPDIDEFLVCKNMIPGDSVDGVISLQNKFSDAYNIYIRAETPSGDTSFIDSLKLILNCDTDLSYDGGLNANAQLSENVLIGTINPGEKKDIVANVSLDGPSVGNDLRGKNAEVVWTLTATRNVDDSDLSDEDVVHKPGFPPLTFALLRNYGTQLVVVSVLLAIILISYVAYKYYKKRN